MKHWIASLLLALAALPAQAETLDVNVGSVSLRAALSGPLSRLFTVTQGQYDLGIVTRINDDDRDFTQGHVGVLVTGDVGAPNADIKAGLGLRFIYAGLDVNDDNGGALAFGGQFEARLPQYNRVSLAGSIFGAPDITSFNDLDAYIEYGFDLGYDIIRNGTVYGGFRQINYDIGRLRDFGDPERPHGNTAFDSGLHAGFRLTF